MLLAAGGTGGHLFPAEALAHELISRGFSIQLITDARARKFADEFPADEIHVVESATLGEKNPVALLKMIAALYKGYRASKAIIKNTDAVAVIGFGGYPTVPPLMAASRMRFPTLVHEQNAVLGRANRMLAKRVNGVAVGFKQVGEKPDVPIVQTGNPVRPIVMSVKDKAYPKRKAGDMFRLVVFGGSQGARFFSEIMPSALSLMEQKDVAKLSVLQQAREEDQQQLQTQYNDLSLKFNIAPFFKNMPEEIANAHFVIGRAGASTVTELAVIGRPSLLVPFPGSLDGDQANNAIAMREANGAELVKQSDLNPERLAEILTRAINEPEWLVQMGKAAKQTGMPDAASRLADCVECVISGGDISRL